MVTISKQCPFCRAKGELKEENTRVGYGDYESNVSCFVVECLGCGAKAQWFAIKTLCDFTTHTVEDFRNNPILRAEVEDQYETYLKELKEKAIMAWEKRNGGNERS